MNRGTALEKYLPFVISGTIDGPTYSTLTGGAGVADSTFGLLAVFVWPRDILITSWLLSYQGTSTVIGPLQNLLVGAVIGNGSNAVSLYGVPDQGANTAIQNVFTVLNGTPGYYPAGASGAGSPALATQSGDLAMSFSKGEGLVLKANQSLGLYGSLSAYTQYDLIFGALQFCSIELPP
jgi:hypothetical protein